MSSDHSEESIAHALEHEEEFFPKVSIDIQKQLYNQFCDLIKRESHSNNMTQFIDSMVDLEFLEKGIQKEQVFSSLAIDLGGSSLKISTVVISCKVGQRPEFMAVDSMKFHYSDEKDFVLKNLKWNDWTAVKIKKYLIEKQAIEMIGVGRPIQYGSLTFSFKIKQRALNFATVEECNKNFEFSREGLLDVNIVEELNNSLENVGMRLRIRCVINDVIATFVTAYALGHKNPVGIIVGTGTNAGFIIKKAGKSTIINSEWGSTRFDKNIVDSYTLNLTVGVFMKACLSR